MFSALENHHRDFYDLYCTAVLHDVLEDSDITAQDLLDRGISQKVINSVIVLTKQKNEQYEDYINRICSSGDIVALWVKSYDLKHNLSPDRAVLSDEKRAKYNNAHNQVCLTICDYYRPEPEEA